MFPIRMTHPQHGFTHAHDAHEVDRLKKLGWSNEPIPTALDAVLEGFKNTEPKKKRAYNRKAA